MSHTICIARFDEDVSWAFPYAANVVVCNKGEALESPLPQIRMRNCGREEFAYLQFIVAHYDCLSDITIFVQADLRDHLDQYEGRRFENPGSLINYMLLQCKKFGHSMNALPHRLGSCSAHRGLKLATHYPHLVDSQKTFGEWFEENVNSPFPDDPKWFKNGIFGIHKHHILSRSRQYYERMLEQFASSDEHEVGHYFERSWYYIFNIEEMSLQSTY